LKDWILNLFSCIWQGVTINANGLTNIGQDDFVLFYLANFAKEDFVLLKLAARNNSLLRLILPCYENIVSSCLGDRRLSSVFS
jgi:hypothetical protein